MTTNKIFLFTIAAITVFLVAAVPAQAAEKTKVFTSTKMKFSLRVEKSWVSSRLLEDGDIVSFTLPTKTMESELKKGRLYTATIMNMKASTLGKTDAAALKKDFYTYFFKDKDKVAKTLTSGSGTTKTKTTTTMAKYYLKNYKAIKLVMKSSSPSGSSVTQAIILTKDSKTLYYVMDSYINTKMTTPPLNPHQAEFNALAASFRVL